MILLLDTGCISNKLKLIIPSLNLFHRVKKKENDKDEDLKEEDREPKDRRCFQCGDMGHVRRDCPEYRHLKQRAPGAPGTFRKIFILMILTVIYHFKLILQ